MCGIVGYVGPQAALDVVVEGLRRLEYRGYDSAGVAIVTDGVLQVAKKAGKLAKLEKELSEQPLPRTGLGLGHTRWATHGAPNDVNAHPHVSADGRIALVHNGIVENYVTLRDELAGVGITPVSETDTEIVAHLLGREVSAGARLDDAMRTVCGRLNGAFTLVAVDSHNPDAVVAARRNSPLVVGVGQGENFVASDVAAFIQHTRDAIELGQDQVVMITRDDVTVTTFDGRPAEVKPYHVDWDLSAAEKGGYDWFMRKEIFEQPKAVADTLLGRHDANGRLTLDEIRISEAELRTIDKIVIVACGTANYAGLVAKYAIEHWTRIPCEVELASEFRYRDPIVGPTTLVVAISQSGETADTLMAIRHAREQRARVLAICNTNGSTIPAGVRRGDLHPRRPGDRRRLDQGLHDPAGGLLPARAVSRAGPGDQVRRRDQGHDARAGDDAGGDHQGAGRDRAGDEAGGGVRRRAARCCSWAGTSAFRWRSRVR